MGGDGKPSDTLRVYLMWSLTARPADEASAYSMGGGLAWFAPVLSFVMAGLVPAIPIHDTRRMRQFYVYILASRPGGAIYVGVTNDLMRRVFEHKQKMIQGHTKRYGIDKLVYFEVYDSSQTALQ